MALRVLVCNNYCRVFGKWPSVTSRVPFASFHAIVGEKLVYSEYGDPVKVLRSEPIKIDEGPGKGEVLVKMLAASVNPADINTIQGVYAVKPPLPSTPGNEGVGVIEAVGEGVTDLSEGDWVLPRKNAWGTWRTHAVCPADELMSIRNDLDVAMAATLVVNPCTAFRMLRDYESLESGDTVIQNGGNSAVGQAVIQLCRHWGINTVNVVRNRSDIQELKKWLTSMGATSVLTEEEVRTCTLFKTSLKPPRLALNCIGGKNALEILRHLDHGGTMVTYGGMSRQPLTIPTSAFIFKDLKMRGFWMTRWNWEHETDPLRTHMMQEIGKLAKDGVIKPPVHAFLPLGNFQEALKSVSDTAGFVGCKFIFKFD